MSHGKSLALSSGAHIPQLGLGTWQAEPKDVERAVEVAIRNGYRHLDLAFVYQNQAEVGAALKKVIPSVVQREELWITSKLWNTGHQPQEVEKELNKTLEQLGLDYLDLYLIHWPVAFPPGDGMFPEHPSNPDFEVALDTSTSLVETWKAMIALPKSKVRNIGVSNFTVEHIKALAKATGVVPTVNKVEAHPLLQQQKLVVFCKKHEIQLIAYSPLGNNTIGAPLLTEHPTITEIATRLRVSPAQVLIAWGIQRGFAVIPKSVHESWIISNFQQVELSGEDFDKVMGIGEEMQVRYNIPYRYEPKWDIGIFGDEAEEGAKHRIKII
uniref:NADP-dependent oxidoreductase domain-containing protein n=1 Tax=Mycena chlorophos TaxID=658473 RepID=A0ABQ0LMW7_MYCCL|nr:predicted protein [Mycena chlorophos]